MAPKGAPAAAHSETKPLDPRSAGAPYGSDAELGPSQHPGARKPEPLAERVRKHLEGVAVMILVPWLSFVFVLCFIAFAEPEPSGTWRGLAYVFTVVVFCAGVTHVAVYYSTHSSVYLYLGVTILLSAVAGFGFGSHIYSEDVSLFWLKQRQPTYSNVSPTASAAAFPDAGMIHFTSDSRVDLRRSFGLRPQGTDSVYCVAPILMDGQLEQANFWAVGIDCCGATWGFHCGDVYDETSHSGGVVSSMGSDSNSVERVKHFREAAKQAAALYRMVSPQDPVLVLWLRDPADAEGELLAHAVKGVGVLTILSLLGSIFTTGWAHWTSISQRMRKSPA